MSYLIKKSFLDTEWWEFVQPSVKNGLDFIIDNIDVLGLRFRDSFMSMFKYEHTKRLLQHEAFDSTVPGAFADFPEECYQSGMTPARVLLGLEEWVKPTDMDVLAAFHLCQQIDILESKNCLPTMNLGKEEESKETFKKLINEILLKMNQKKKQD
jgi:hypothetical protein